MIFEKLIRIPEARIGALVGKSGAIKSKIESLCYVKLDIQSDTGEIMITSKDAVDVLLPFKAVEIVTSIGRGFSADRAFALLDNDYSLQILDIRYFVGKSSSQIERIKGRIIGKNGKARRNLENLTGTYISVYGKTVSVIGHTKKMQLTIDAITSICKGSVHRSVYNKLESARRTDKQECMILWEGQNVN